MVVIRSALASDHHAIARVFHDSVHQIACQDYSDEQLDAWSPRELPAEYWQQRTAGLEVRVALLDEALAGFIAFTHAGYIDLLYTHPEFARRGVARALLRDAESTLGALGVKMLWTEASVTARGFFEAMGFRVVQQQTVECSNVQMRNYRMQKLRASL